MLRRCCCCILQRICFHCGEGFVARRICSCSPTIHKLMTAFISTNLRLRKKAIAHFRIDKRTLVLVVLFEMDLFQSPHEESNSPFLSFYAPLLGSLFFPIIIIKMIICHSIDDYKRRTCKRSTWVHRQNGFVSA